MSPIPTTTNIANPRQYGYGVALDGRLFRLSTRPRAYEVGITTAPIEPPKFDTTSSPEEAAEDFGRSFSRSQFEGGEGLFRAHTADAEPDRFWDSKNIEVRPVEPGEFPEIRLLNSTDDIETSAVSGLRMAYDPLGGALYMCEGNTLRRTTNPIAATPTFADDDPHNGETATTVQDVAVLGDEVFAALGANGLHRRSSGSWAHYGDNPSSEEYERVWSVKGRIVASTGQSLYEVTASGAAPSATLTLAPGESFTDVCDGGDFVLVGATDGYVYAFSTDSGSLVLESQTPFEGEIPRALGQTQGVVAVGTEQDDVGRLTVGELSASGQIVNQRVVRQWGDDGTATDQAPRRIVGGLRDAIITGVPDGTDTALWRYDVVTGGMSRDLTVAAASGLVEGIEVIEGRAFFSIAADGMHRRSTSYASEGYLIGPLGDFVSSAPKQWVGSRLETGAIVSGQKVELFYTTDPDALSDPDSTSWTKLVTRTSGKGDPGEQVLSDVQGRAIAGMVKLYPSSDSSSSPAVRSFSFRAFTSSGDETELILELPINVSDRVERYGMAGRRVKGRGEREFQALIGMRGAAVLAETFDPALKLRGVVQQVATPVKQITRRGSVTDVSLVTVRGRVVVSDATGTTGPGAMGTYHVIGTTPLIGEAA